jgi:PAS domain S-box-containing protein
MIALHLDKAVIGTIEGCQVPIVNCYNEIASDLLGELAEDHPFAAGYQDQGNQRKWSLRSNASGADVAEIATRFGGGGHRHAAGFITELPEGLLHLSSQEPGKPRAVWQENPDTNARLYQELEESESKLKEAENILHYSEERYRALFRDNPTMIVTLDGDLRMLSVNPACASQLGYTINELEGQSVLKLFLAEDHPAITEQLRKCLRNPKQVHRWQFRKIRKDGEILWVEEIAQALYGRNGVLNLLVVCQDITERQRAEVALRASENKFANAFQATPSILVIASLADGRYLEVNEAFERVMGYRRDEVIGHSSLELNIWQNQEDRATVLRMLAEGKKVRDLEINFVSKSGAVIVGLYSADIIAIGAEQCLLSLVNDISARKKAEDELRHGEERYRRLYNETPVMLHSIDHDGRLVSVSNYWLETLGYERSEVLGRISTDFHTETSRSYATEVVLPEFFRTGSCKNVPYQLVKKNGEIMDVLLSAIAERDSEGKVVRSLAVSIDVTDRKRAEEEIARLNVTLAARAAELEDANRELETFNYTVAHDLRQPLNAIGLNCQALDLLCGTSLSKECKGYIQGSYEGTLRMNQMIEALLNFSIMAHAQLSRGRVDLSSMAKAVAAELQGAKAARLVTFQIAEGISTDGDPSLLRVVLDNLLGNAWKYTAKQEKAVIEFGVKEIDGVPAYFVRDNGAGFDKTDEDKLFLPFQRLPGAEECKGFGIGLATVERIIRRHGGKIWAEGEPGKGAAFFFTLATE